MWNSVCRLGLLILISTFWLSGDLYAQNSREIETRRIPPAVKESTNQKKLSKKQAKKELDKRYSAYFDRLVVEYEARMEQNAESHRKMAKELRKPQYSDPSYFGHRKPPKKRARGKKRKCKECHMWH